MATLHAFATWLLPRDGSVTTQASGKANYNYYSKPDQIGGSFELRRIKLKRLESHVDPRGRGLNEDWPQTDFYEYYWAHHMYGTTVSHVLRWMIRLLYTSWRDRKAASEVGWLFRPGCRGPMALVAAAVLAVLIIVPALTSWFASLGIMILGAAVWMGARLLGRFALLDVVGDAARYFDVHPTNVARRYDILRGGVEVLRKLHEFRDEGGGQARCRYGRIVLVGHSLGSVIAYDIAKHYWALVNGHLRIESRTADVLDKVAEFGKPGPAVLEVDSNALRHSFWSNQARAWAAMNERKWFDEATPAEIPPPTRWLVTDLVTLGSPLAYARFLLADGPDDFEQKVAKRELPTCPPDRSTTVNEGYYTVPLWAEAEPVGDNYTILHHAALFAATRWTNIHLANDPVGYRLDHMGSGIREISIADADGPSMFSAHTSYWLAAEPTPRWSNEIHHQLLAVLKRDVYADADVAKTATVGAAATSVSARRAAAG
jgi:hypothetical protein